MCLYYPVDDCAVADDVVCDDDCARLRKAQRPIEVCRVAGLVGIDEDEVEGLCSICVQLRQRIESGAEPDFDFRGKAGMGDIRSCHVGVFRVQLEGD